MVAGTSSTSIPTKHHHGAKAVWMHSKLNLELNVQLAISANTGNVTMMVALKKSEPGG